LVTNGLTYSQWTVPQLLLVVALVLVFGALVLAEAPGSAAALVLALVMVMALVTAVVKVMVTVTRHWSCSWLGMVVRHPAAGHLPSLCCSVAAHCILAWGLQQHPYCLHLQGKGHQQATLSSAESARVWPQGFWSACGRTLYCHSTVVLPAGRICVCNLLRQSLGGMKCCMQAQANKDTPNLISYQPQ
jgi:hypothetical protein